jgi:hypothetical protein
VLAVKFPGSSSQVKLALIVLSQKSVFHYALIQIVSLMRQFHQILRNHFAFEVIPETFADSVARVHCRLPGPRLRAQVSVSNTMSLRTGSVLCLMPPVAVRYPRRN